MKFELENGQRVREKGMESQVAVGLMIIPGSAEELLLVGGTKGRVFFSP